MQNIKDTKLNEYIEKASGIIKLLPVNKWIENNIPKPEKKEPKRITLKKPRFKKLTPPKFKKVKLNTHRK